MLSEATIDSLLMDVPGAFVGRSITKGSSATDLAVAVTKRKTTKSGIQKLEKHDIKNGHE